METYTDKASPPASLPSATPRWRAATSPGAMADRPRKHEKWGCHGSLTGLKHGK